MRGFDTSDGYRIAPMDSDEGRIGDEERHENTDRGYEIDPILSSPDFQFSEEDPAMIEEPSRYPSEAATFDPEAAREKINE